MIIKKRQGYKGKRFDRRVALDPSIDMLKDAHALLRFATTSGYAREQLILENLIDATASGRVSLPTVSRELKRVRGAMGVFDGQDELGTRKG